MMYYFLSAADKPLHLNIGCVVGAVLVVVAALIMATKDDDR